MSTYLLFYDHYEEGKKGGEEFSMDLFPGETDSLKEELEKDIRDLQASSPDYPEGHPIFIKKGLEFVMVEPGSEEAKFKRIRGNLEKM